MEIVYYLNFVAQGVITAPVIKKILHKTGDIIQITRVVNSIDVVTEYDFNNTPIMDTVSRPDYQDSVYRFLKDAAGVLHVWIAVVLPTGTSPPQSDSQEVRHSTPATVWKATGEDDSVGTASGTQPDWIPGALTEAEKQARVSAELVLWRAQIADWLLQAPRYASLISDILNHLGKWLKSADYLIHTLVVSETRLDWLLLEAIIKEARKGPRSLDPDGDGAYNAEFFMLFQSAVTSYPNGPDFGALWVNWYEISDTSEVSDVTRVQNMINDVLHPLHIGTRTRAGMPSNYNPTTQYWTS